MVTDIKICNKQYNDIYYCELHGAYVVLSCNRDIDLSLFENYSLKHFHSAIGIFAQNIVPFADYDKSIYNRFSLFGYDVQVGCQIESLQFIFLKSVYILNHIRLLQQLTWKDMSGFVVLMSQIHRVDLIWNNQIIHLQKKNILRYFDERVTEIVHYFQRHTDYISDGYFYNTQLNLHSLQYIDFELYKEMNSDLSLLDHDQLVKHYLYHGRYESRPLCLHTYPSFQQMQCSFTKHVDIKIMFINFPQFHQDELNDKFWGSGWTDWTNIQKMQCFFTTDDKRVNTPLLGYYDYTEKHPRQTHGEWLQKYSNMTGFIYYYYYFDGTKALYKPLENMLKDGQPQTDFFLLWANERWGRRWDSNDTESEHILIDQTYSKDFWEPHFQHLLQYFQHPRYMKQDNRPLFGLCITSHFNDPSHHGMLDYFSSRIKDYGFDGLHYCQYLNKYHEKSNMYQEICTIAIERQPNYIINYFPHDVIFSNQYNHTFGNLSKISLFEEFNEERYVSFHIDIRRAIERHDLPSGLHHWNLISPMEKDYRKFIYKIYRFKDICKWILLSQHYSERQTMYGFFANWDNTSRIMSTDCPNNICTKVVENCPAQLYMYLTKLFEKIRLSSVHDTERVVFNAWNEWGETNQIEPCQRYGFQRMDAIQHAQQQFHSNTRFLESISKKQVILIFTHYGGGGTEKFLQQFPEHPDKIYFVIRPSSLFPDMLLLHSLHQRKQIPLTHFKDYEIHHYDYYNIMFLEEFNLLYNFILFMHPKCILVNSLVGFSNIIYTLIFQLKQVHSIKIITYLHDYYYLHPQPQVPFHELASWKPIPSKLFNLKSRLLQSSDHIFCPTQSTKNIYLRFFPSLSITVLYHVPISKNFPSVISISKKPRYKVLIYGELNTNKGVSIIQQLIQETTNIDFVVYGRHSLVSTSNLTVHGPYIHEHLPQIIEKEGPDVILFTSLFAETFCYAFVPALHSKYPIICPPYGSFPELAHQRRNTYYIDPFDLTPHKLHDILQQFQDSYQSPLYTNNMSSSPPSFSIEQLFLISCQ